MENKITRRRLIVQGLAVSAATILASHQSEAKDHDNSGTASFADTVAWLKEKITTECGTDPAPNVGYWTYPTFDVVGTTLTFVQYCHPNIPLSGPQPPDPFQVYTYTCKLEQLDPNVVPSHPDEQTFPSIDIGTTGGDVYILEKFEDRQAPANNIQKDVATFDFYAKTDEMAARITLALSHLIRLAVKANPPAKEPF